MSERVDYSRENRFLAIALAAVAAFYIVSYHYHQARERTAPRRLAERIVDPDQESDDGASYDVARFGAEIIQPMMAASNNFEVINQYNAGRIGRVLAFTRTEEAIEIGRNMYSDTDNYRRLTGAYVLIVNNVYPEEIDRDCFLARRARSTTLGYELAAEILARLDDEAVLPLLVEAAHNGATPFAVCERFMESDSPVAAAGLMACLDHCGAVCSWYGARLIEIEGSDAVGPIIDKLPRLDNAPERGYERSFAAFENRITQLPELLEELAGERVGESYEEWHQWWSESKDGWSIPEDFDTDRFKRDFELVAWFGLGREFRLFYVLSFPLIWIVLGISNSRRIRAEEGEAVYAGVFPRLTAVITDLYLIAVPSIVVLYFAHGKSAVIGVAVIIIGPLAWLISTIFFNGMYGATVGKMLHRIEVRGVDGQSMDVRRALYRHAVDAVLVLAGVLATLLAVVPIRDSLRTRELWLPFVDWFADARPYWGAFSDRAELVWLLIAVIALPFVRKKRAIRDIISGTVVVHRPRKNQP